MVHSPAKRYVRSAAMVAGQKSREGRFRFISLEWGRRLTQNKHGLSRFTVICRDSPVIVPCWERSGGQPLGGLPVRAGAKPNPKQARSQREWPHPDSFAAAGMRGGEGQYGGGFWVGDILLIHSRQFYSLRSLPETSTCKLRRGSHP